MYSSGREAGGWAADGCSGSPRGTSQTGHRLASRPVSASQRGQTKPTGILLPSSCPCRSVCQARCWCLAKGGKAGRLALALVLGAALAQERADLAADTFGHLDGERFAGDLGCLLVGFEELDAVWAIAQVSLEALP